MKNVIVIGGGPAGIFAGYYASKSNCNITILEKNEKLGKKMEITGKGRCNITNMSDYDTFFDNIVTNKKFLFSAFHAFNNYDTIDFFESIGVKTKVERGNRVFPQSDSAKEVVGALKTQLMRQNIVVKLNTKVQQLMVEDKKVTGVIIDSGEKIYADAVIVATGGISYPGTGSTGDGYKFGKKIGHNIVECKPALVPLEIREQWVKDLQGLSLKNISIRIEKENKTIYEQFGEMLFTHFGVSGPAVLSASSYIKDSMNSDLKLIIDLKPALDEDKLDKRLLRDFEAKNKKDFRNALDDLLPKKLIPIIIHLSGINNEKKVYEVTKKERKKIVSLLKNLECRISGARSIKEAIVTAGGIDVKEINPTTMESKIIKDLYFVGEVLDLDALTGGYNLQIAFSTGYLAGININNK